MAGINITLTLTEKECNSVLFGLEYLHSDNPELTDRQAQSIDDLIEKFMSAKTEAANVELRRIEPLYSVGGSKKNLWIVGISDDKQLLYLEDSAGELYSFSPPEQVTLTHPPQKDI